MAKTGRFKIRSLAKEARAVLGADLITHTGSFWSYKFHQDTPFERLIKNLI